MRFFKKIIIKLLALFDIKFTHSYFEQKFILYLKKKHKLYT